MQYECFMSRAHSTVVWQLWCLQHLYLHISSNSFHHMPVIYKLSVPVDWGDKNLHMKYLKQTIFFPPLHLQDSRKAPDLSKCPDLPEYHFVIFQSCADNFSPAEEGSEPCDVCSSNLCANKRGIKPHSVGDVLPSGVMRLVGSRVVGAWGSAELQHTAQLSLSSAQMKQKRAAISIYRRVVRVLHVNFMQFHSLSAVRGWISLGVLGREALGFPTGMVVGLHFIYCYSNAPSRYVCITVTYAASKNHTNI